MSEKIQIVDENDQPIGVSSRREAWIKGSYHRLVQIVLRDQDGNFLLQKRSLKKTLYPGRWTNAASGHVDAGETYETSALRELEEEIGVTIPLKYLGKVLVRFKEGDKIINQFNGVFIGQIPHDTSFDLNPDEVSEVRWFTLDELRDKTANYPEDFTPAMMRAVKEFYS